MQIVIDIPEGLKKDFESEQWTALSCMEMKDALMNGTPQRPKAKWIIHPIDCHLACSKCLTRAPYDCKTNFCPVCGAEMSGGEEDEDGKSL